MEELIEKYEKRSYSTYKSRLEAYERLKRQNICWNIALISSSFTTIAVSIAILNKSNINQISTLLIIISILNLVCSLIVPTMKFPKRIEDMRNSYLEAQISSQNFEYLRLSQQEPNLTNKKLFEEIEKYQRNLLNAENHAKRDYKNSKKSKIPIFIRSIFCWLLDSYPITLFIITIAASIALLV
ncbi:Uncharacterised protein [Mycobacteroides abscessus subsp. bolletii]|nr:Uncharacterised protein [Mycobacteroides abscessus subsp. bolletii]